MSYDTFKDITIQQLEILISLIEAGSFTRAAGKLHLSQPSLTKQIQNLEVATGTQLVNRGGSECVRRNQESMAALIHKKATQLGADIYLHKGQGPDELLAMVRRLRELLERSGAAIS